MKYETAVSAQTCVVTLAGDVDVSCAEELATLEKRLASKTQVIVDVADLGYADTNFLRFLLKLKKHENKSQREAVRLVRVNLRLQRLLEITGLSRVFACEAGKTYA
jgi:anti-anti-sigma factor